MAEHPTGQAEREPDGLAEAELPETETETGTELVAARAPGTEPGGPEGAELTGTELVAVAAAGTELDAAAAAATETGAAEETEAEEELDPEVVARRAVALAHVRKFGDPVLRTKARPVDRFDDTLRDEVRRMGDLMIDALGVGLAATQVGVLNRVLVYRVHQQSPVAALVNPLIEWSGDDQETLEEGCLSLPAVHVDVERPVHVRVRALTEYGESITIEASGLEARVIQHEVDHLDGILVLDRISRSQRKDAMRALREAQQAA